MKDIRVITTREFEVNVPRAHAHSTEAIGGGPDSAPRSAAAAGAPRESHGVTRRLDLRDGLEPARTGPLELRGSQIEGPVIAATPAPWAVEERWGIARRSRWGCAVPRGATSG